MNIQNSMLDFKKIGREKEQYYTKEKLSQRLEIELEYKKTENALNDFYEKKLSASDLSNELGISVLGFRGESPSSQIYAYECLFKALAETEDAKDVDEIVNEIIFDVALEPPTLKQEYLLGILAYYASKSKAEELEKKLREEEPIEKILEKAPVKEAIYKAKLERATETKSTIQEIREMWEDLPLQELQDLEALEKDADLRIEKFKQALEEQIRERKESQKKERPKPKDVQPEEELKILINIFKGVEGIKRAGKLAPEIQKIIDLITNDFPRETEEGALARLCSKYYSKEAHATRMPDPSAKFSSIQENLRAIDQERESSGIPELVYILPPGRHTSQKKIAEAEEWGIPLFTEAAVYREKYEKEVKIGVLYDLSPEECFEYIRAVREAKDAKNWENLRKLKEDFKNKIWSDLDESAKKIIGGKEEMMVLVQTIKDYSEEEITKIKKILEEIEKLSREGKAA